MSWVFLAAALAFEVTATMALRASEGLRNKAWAPAVVGGYVTCFVFLSLALRAGLAVGVGIVDPSGNTIIFVQRDEPAELEYGGSKRLRGLTRVLDNARILREFKNDDLAAFRALNSGLRRHGDAAPAVEQALALAGLIELSIALEKPELVPDWGARLTTLPLTAPERERVRQAVAEPAVLGPWLPGTN